MNKRRHPKTTVHYHSYTMSLCVSAMKLMQMTMSHKKKKKNEVRKSIWNKQETSQNICSRWSRWRIHQVWFHYLQHQEQLRQDETEPTALPGSQTVSSLNVRLWRQTCPQHMGEKRKGKNNKVKRVNTEASERYIIIPPPWHSVGLDLTRLLGCQSGLIK